MATVNRLPAGIHHSSKPTIVAKDPTFFSKGIMSVLNGRVTFPYTPTIQVSHNAVYGTYDLPHSVYQSHFYSHTQNPTIQITAPFTAVDKVDAAYAAAAIQFFKVATKSDFGLAAKARGTAGSPPPVLLFSAYGELNFKMVPVVVKNFAYTLVEDADYVEFDHQSFGTVTLPSAFVIQLDLGVQQAPVKHKQFNLSDYASGASIKRGEGWI